MRTTSAIDLYARTQRTLPTAPPRRHEPAQRSGNQQQRDWRQSHFAWVG